MPKTRTSTLAVRARRPIEAVTLESLSPRKRAFVRAYLENLEAGNVGRSSTIDAVQAAGISSTNRNAAKVRASEFMRDPGVLAVLQSEQIRKLHAGSALGVAVLIDLARTATSESVRLQAATQLIDRSPIGPVISRSAVLTAAVTVEQMLETLDIQEAEEAAEAASTSVTPAKGAAPGASVAARPGPADGAEDGVIDAEFRAVEPIGLRWVAAARQAAMEAAERVDATQHGEA